MLQSLLILSAGLTTVPQQRWLEMAVYLTGLIVEKNVTSTSIAGAVGLLSHDRLSRLLTTFGLQLSKAACLAVRFVEALGIEGFLIIDDVLIPKPFAKAIALCAWDWDHSRKRNTFGQRLVFIVWSNGWLIIPLLFTFWQKAQGESKRKRKLRGKGRRRKLGRPITDNSAKARQRRVRRRAKMLLAKKRRKRLSDGRHYRSKNQLARVMFYLLMRRGLKVRFILFDNWYASKQNICLFERFGLYWATRVRDNIKVFYKAETIKVKEVARSVKKANYHYYSRLKARARSFEVEVAGKLRKLTVIKDDTSPESCSTKYLLTNCRQLTTCQHIEWYRRRWLIEIFFRDAKQHFGLCGCEARTERTVISHVALVCIAYTFMQLFRPNDAEQRPSLKTSKYAMAGLIIVRLKNKCSVVSQLSDGKLQTASLTVFWHIARTRLPAIVLPESPVFL